MCSLGARCEHVVCVEVVRLEVPAVARDGCDQIFGVKSGGAEVVLSANVILMWEVLVFIMRSEDEHDGCGSFISVIDGGLFVWGFDVLGEVCVAGG